MVMRRLIIRQNGRDVSDEIRRNDAGALFGYSSATLWHETEEVIGGATMRIVSNIGVVSCGRVSLTAEALAAGYTVEDVRRRTA